MSSDDTAAVERTPLTVLADKYDVIKKEAAVSLRGCQGASRFGGTPVFADSEEPTRKQDARKIAADRLGAGVSHTTLEKVLWLRRIAFDTERPRKLREAALEAYGEIDKGGPVDWPYTRVHTLVLIDNLEQAAAESSSQQCGQADRRASVEEAARLRRLRSHPGDETRGTSSLGGCPPPGSDA